MRQFLRAGVVVLALALSGVLSYAASPRWTYYDTRKVREAITLKIGDSVFVGFAVRDVSPHVFRGGAYFTSCGTKQLYARFYADAALTRPITGDSIDVTIPCPGTDTTKAPPPPGDTTKEPPTLGETIGADGLPLCAGSVSDTSIHLPYCSRPNDWPLFITSFSDSTTVTGCWTSVPREALTFDKRFDCAETTAMLSRTNVFPTILP